MKFTKKEILTLSNALSFSRLLMAIPLWILLDNFTGNSNRGILIAICLLAALSDILDGYFARKRNEVTEVGKIIDPLADKVIVGIVIIKLYIIGLIHLYYFLMILGRDAAIFLGGIYVSKKLGRVLPSNILGKVTVIVISIVIILILFNIQRTSLVFSAFYYSSIFLIFVSLYGYIVRAKEFLNKNNGTIQQL